MRRLKVLLCAAALLIALAFVPKSDAQVSINIGVPPVCAYGYYDYAPYACAPMGFYGPGYFYNGIFLGVGPWHYWGYRHGWGNHRFYRAGGGRYVPGRGGYGRPGYRGGHASPAYRGGRSAPAYRGGHTNSRPAARPQAHGNARPSGGHGNDRPK